MIVFLDSSIIVAAVAEIEPHHQPCAALLLGTHSLRIRSHALAEAFSTLTGGRPWDCASPPRMPCNC